MNLMVLFILVEITKIALTFKGATKLKIKISNIAKMGILISTVLMNQIATASTEVEKEPVLHNDYSDIVKELEDKFEYEGIIEYIAKSDDKGGYFAVLSDGSNIYYNKDSENIVMGDIFEIKSKKNISESLKGTYNLKVLEVINDEDKISYPSEKENADWVTVYTDPTCGYCRKIQENIKGYNDLGISISYIPSPRGAEGSRPYHELTQIWCSKDRHKSLELAKSDKAHLIDFKEDEACKSIVEKGLQTGEKLKVRGTPSIYTENGHNIPGFVTPEQLREIIDQTK